VTSARRPRRLRPRAAPGPAPAPRGIFRLPGTAQTETLRDALLFSQPMDRSAEVRTTKGTTRLLGHIASSPPPYYRKAFTLTRRKRKGLPRCVINLSSFVSTWHKAGVPRRALTVPPMWPLASGAVVVRRAFSFFVPQLDGHDPPATGGERRDAMRLM